MRLIYILSIAIAATILSSCSGGKAGAGAEAPEEVSRLLHTVPSDALAVSVRSCAEAVAMLDSADVLRNLDYGRNANSPAVISWCFDGSLSPVLAIDAGRSSAGISSARQIVSKADSLGLFTAYYAPDSLVGRHAILVITPSEALLTAAGRHITEGRSILDADGFVEALAFAGGSRKFTILRNSGASRLIPGDFFKGLSTQRKAANFLRTVSDWITITPETRGRYKINVTRGDAPSYYTNMLARLPFADSHLGDILPDDTEFAVALPVPQPEFREAFQRYEDASVRYTAYTRRLDALKERTGKNPLDWEKETGVREVAIAVRDGRKIVAVRPSKAPADSPVADNPWRGFVPALYGNAFELTDDSSCAATGGWLIYGKAEDLEQFIAAQVRPFEKNWPRKGIHIVMYKSGNMICWGKKGIDLWNSNQ